MRAKSQRGFTLIEVLIATLILAVAVSALLGNLSTSTANLMRTGDLDRLTFLSKRKMDELITNQRNYGNFEGPLEVDAANKPTAGFRAQITLVSAPGQNTGDRLERIVLDTWMQSGSRRRTLQLLSLRTTRYR
jgi:general secretion pathway protein I